ncbi:MAG: hypothetical protein NTX25_07945 [Proteobacteria bacterium]|nr:hypothetical protein [Pseudomonadota bacterium]
MRNPSWITIQLVALLSLEVGCGRHDRSSSSRLASIRNGPVEHAQPLKMITASTPISVSSSEMGYAGSVLQIDTLPVGNQFAPKLALSYTSSMTEVGIAGLGWSLAGVNSISRCASQILFDGKSNAIEWTNADSWCMDGKKLLLISGIADTDGAEYRFYLDDKTKVTYQSGHFEVSKKSGERLVFGETEASREDGLNGAFLSYNLNRQLDRSGNSVDFIYAKEGGRLFLDQVQYGGNADFNRPHYRTISFQYEKPDVSVPRYIAGQKYEADRLLKSITVGNDEKVSWTYRLHHERKTPAAFPVLVAVDQCFKVLECTPKTTFEYDLPDTISVTESPEFIWPEFGTQSSLTWAPDKSARAFVDLNGDGYPDILGITRTAINFKTSYSLRTTSRPLELT